MDERRAALISLIQVAEETGLYERFEGPKLRAGILAGRRDIAEGRSKVFDAALIRDIGRRGKEKAKHRQADRSAESTSSSNDFAESDTP